MSSTKFKRSLRYTTLTSLSLCLSVVWFIPVYLVLTNSLKEDRDILTNPNGVPVHLMFHNYVTAFQRGGFAESFFNSVSIAAISTFFIVMICAGIAYPLGRMKNRLNQLIYYLFLAGLMVPTGLTLTSNSHLFKMLGIINTPFVVICIEIVNFMPFAVFLYTGFIQSVPKELDEAANIDGCTPLMTFWRIIFPLLKPVTSAAVILTSVPIFNDFVTPLLYASKIKTVTLGLYNFRGMYTTEWNMLFAGATITMLPPIVVFVIFQRYFERGLVAGAIKG